MTEHVRGGSQAEGDPCLILAFQRASPVLPAGLTPFLPADLPAKVDFSDQLALRATARPFLFSRPFLTPFNTPGGGGGRWTPARPQPAGGGCAHRGAVPLVSHQAQNTALRSPGHREKGRQRTSLARAGRSRSRG